jgi:hypothetical protein
MQIREYDLQPNNEVVPCIALGENTRWKDIDNLRNPSFGSLLGHYVLIKIYWFRILYNNENRSSRQESPTI